MKYGKNLFILVMLLFSMPLAFAQGGVQENMQAGAGAGAQEESSFMVAAGETVRFGDLGVYVSEIQLGDSQASKKAFVVLSHNMLRVTSKEQGLSVGKTSNMLNYQIKVLSISESQAEFFVKQTSARPESASKSGEGFGLEKDQKSIVDGDVVVELLWTMGEGDKGNANLKLSRYVPNTNKLVTQVVRVYQNKEYEFEGYTYRLLSAENGAAELIFYGSEEEVLEQENNGAQQGNQAGQDEVQNEMNQKPEVSPDVSEGTNAQQNQNNQPESPGKEGLKVNMDEAAALSAAAMGAPSEMPIIVLNEEGNMYVAKRQVALRVLGLFRVRTEYTAYVDAATGDVSVSKPWFAGISSEIPPEPEE